MIQGTRLLIAAPQGVAEKLQHILASAQAEADAVLETGVDALAALEDAPAVLLTVWRLPDMTGPQLARQAQAQGVLMIVPGDYDAQELEGTDALALHNPLSPDALIHAVRTMCHCGAKIGALQERALRAERTLAERKIIERAKGRLMDTLHLTEREAHYRMQKKSMDTGRRIADIAQEILDAQEIQAS